MNLIRSTLIGLCVTTVSLSAFSQNADEHNDHHPAGADTPTSATKKLPAESVSADKKVSMHKQMKDMQTMHEKMAFAKTPEERQALMSEHMKMMQEGMGMMKRMGGMSDMGGMQAGKGMSGNMADQQKMMENRMDMMESMMQMMMDRLAVTEETEMRAQFGAAFDSYASRTPRFIPHIKQTTFQP